MTAVLFVCVAASIGVGYLGVVAEAAIQKLHEVPAIRKTVEGVFMFPLVDLVSRWTETHDVFTVRQLFSRYWLVIRGWLIVAAIVAAALVVIVSVVSAAILWAVVKLLLLLIVLVAVLAGLWLAFRRS